MMSELRKQIEQVKKDCSPTVLECFNDGTLIKYATSLEQQLAAAGLQDEILKRLEAENEYGFTPIFTRFRQDGCGCRYAEYELQLTDCGGEFKGNAPRLYRLPSPQNKGTKS